MVEINKDTVGVGNKKLGDYAQRLQEGIKKRREELTEMFDEQMEEIKELLIKDMMYNVLDSETKTFVELIEKYKESDRALILLANKFEHQRDTLDINSPLLDGIVDTKAIFHTLTYVLKEMGVDDLAEDNDEYEWA